MVREVEFYRDYDLELLKKDFLLEDVSLAVGLAKHNLKFGNHFLAEDYDILALGDGEVACNLVINSRYNNWGEKNIAQKLEVLRLRNGNVAWLLAVYSDVNKWALTPAAQNIDVLGLKDGEVARWLAEFSDKNGWGETEAAKDVKVRRLCGGRVGEMINRVKLEIKKRENHCFV